MQPERQSTKYENGRENSSPIFVAIFFHRKQERDGKSRKRDGDRDKRVHGRTNTNGNTTGTGREPETYTGMTHYKTYIYRDTLHIQWFEAQTSNMCTPRAAFLLALAPSHVFLFNPIKESTKRPTMSLTDHHITNNETTSKKKNSEHIHKANLLLKLNVQSY